MPKSPKEARQRAPKACLRCNKRKLKCDAVQRNGPCSRCRMDGIDGCVLGSSLRGKYVRERRRHDPDSGSSHHKEHQRKLARTTPPTDGNVTTASETSSYAEQIDGRMPRQSSASLSERFVKGNDHTKNKSAAQLGMALLGENSPLTFALKDTHRSLSPDVQNVTISLSNSKLSAKHARNHHPPHCTSEDLNFLAARGAFTYPPAELERLLVAAFLERFYPLYSMVDKEEVIRLHQKSALPYILLHAICLIGATFCDISVLRRFGYETRIQARKSFYDKAKAMFDLEYEQDKFVLLQTIILLSFWGPHMESSWNPCSWIGFGVTIAASLGMHKARSGSHVTGKDSGLVKRVWWALLVRDAYCAALMGRPARVDMFQSDTEPLSLSDFPDNDRNEGGSTEYALYQISIAQLSILVRRMISRCPMADQHSMHPSDLYNMLSHWQMHLPLAVAFDPRETDHRNIFATSLKLLYHYHILFIHLKWPDRELQGSEYDPSLSKPARMIADESAQIVTATASTLSTNRMIEQLPAEAFTGIFMAGIVFNRQLRHSDGPTSPMARASLSCCQLLFDEIREVFDPTAWLIRIFSFLSSETSVDGDQKSVAVPSEDEGQVVVAAAGADSTSGANSLDDTNDIPDGIGDLFSIDWHTAPYDDILESYSDTWFLPDILSAM